MRKSLVILGLYFVAAVSALSGQTPDPVVRFATTLGNIDVQLSPADAPLNVANFLSYVDAGSYNGSFIHRSVPGFVIQGGGYTFVNGSVDTITTQAAVVNEFKLSNVRGTIAMALSGANTATDEWFFNLADNSANLDSQDGGFTVIGHIVNTDGFAVIDAIAALTVIDAGSPFDALPVIDYTSGATIMASNLVDVQSITRLTSHPGFFDGEESVGNAVNYLSFPNGDFFGYYSYLADANYIYHFDLGYEYVIDADDGKGGIYLYDFASGHFFYTSQTFPFPYLYDFTLNAVLYYFPDTTSAGHYTTNPRYFVNLSAGGIFTQ